MRFILKRGQSYQTDKYKSQKQEVVRPFEPRRVSILVEQPPVSAGIFDTMSGTFALTFALVYHNNFFFDIIAPR